MAGIGGFWSSALKGLVEGLKAGTEEGVRIEVEKAQEDERVLKEMGNEKMRAEDGRRRLEEDDRRERERIEEERRKKREEETALWTTPGLRPLAEPPILDWDWLFRVHIPSDLRFKMLFPNDPEKRCMAQDLHGEVAVLREYGHCLSAMRGDPDIESKRREFYTSLFDDVYEDWQDVDTEYKDIWCMATELSRFEFNRLENDGRTTKLEQWIEKGADIFLEQDDEVREKYRHLVPSYFVENRLATFEFGWLEWDGDTTVIERQLMEGNDILEGWPQAVQEKYGHLRRWLPRPPMFHPGTPTSVYSDGVLRYDEISWQPHNLHRPTSQRRSSF